MHKHHLTMIIQVNAVFTLHDRLVHHTRITKHFIHLILFFEHGFRKKKSCQTQHLIIDELMKHVNYKTKYTLFSSTLVKAIYKAFDVVIHEKHLYKIHFYGIRGETFLDQMIF